MLHSDKVDTSAKPVARNTEKFKLLFTNGRPRIKAGTKIVVDCRPSAQLIAERVAMLQAART